MSRTVKVFKALGLGYSFQFLVMITGLWLTPFYLKYLGDKQYGLWLIVTQITTWLALIDLGVIAVLPRDIAIATGKENKEESVSEIVSNALWVVWIQIPIVALLSFVLWWIIVPQFPPLKEPLGFILITFVVTFPLRLPSAILMGLQEMVFLTRTQMIVWIISTVVAVLMAYWGWGLNALVIGWVITQGGGWFLTSIRLRTKYPQFVPHRRIWPTWVALKSRLLPGFWASLNQLSVVLSTGTDVILLGIILGPEAVIIYKCTSMAVTILNQQPMMIGHSIAPIIGEIRGSGNREHLWRICQGLMLTVLMFSGFLGIGICIANEAFVRMWVGIERYGGLDLTALLVVTMILRHWQYTLQYTLFCLGYERALALMGIADGLFILGTTSIGIHLLGMIGIPLGIIAASLLLGLPFCLIIITHESQQSLTRVLGWIVGWLVRFGCLFLMTVLIGILGWNSELLPTILFSLLVVGGYSALMYPLLRRDPLRPYFDRLWGLVTKRKPPDSPAKVQPISPNSNLPSATTDSQQSPD
jgi:O-antigen/teichoic acid export membrane protein